MKWLRKLLRPVAMSLARLEISGLDAGCGFADPNGHHWNVLYMDMNKMPVYKSKKNPQLCIADLFKKNLN